MDSARRAAVTLALAGDIFIEQRKERVDPAAWDMKGIVRLRLVEK